MSRPLPTSVRRTRRDLQAPAALASRGPARLAAAWSLCRSRSQGPQRRTPRPSGPAFGAHTRRRLVELRAVGDVLALRRVVRRVVHELDRLGNHIRYEVLAGAAASPLGPRAPPARPPRAPVPQQAKTTSARLLRRDPRLTSRTCANCKHLRLRFGGTLLWSPHAIPLLPSVAPKSGP